jgi:hypothetical protein
MKVSVTNMTGRGMRRLIKNVGRRINATSATKPTFLTRISSTTIVKDIGAGPA